MYIDNGMFRFGGLTRGVKFLLISFISVYFLQLLMPARLEQQFIDLFGLNVEGIRHGWLWQFITYAFLHGSLFHVLMNSLGLFFLGPEIERHLGLRPFLSLMLFCAVLGGVGWFGLTFPYSGICVGASGAIFGLIGAFAGLFPTRQITLLIFFVLPVTMPAWLMASLFGLLQLAYLLNPGPSGIAYAAHLAGGIAGFLYIRVMYRGYDGQYTGFNLSKISRIIDPQPTEQEIDAILDKISRDGIHTLTAKERALLQKARKK